MDRKPGHLTKDVQQAVNGLTWIKVLGIGNASSGKTCLIKHFCESKYTTGYQPTVGVDYGFKIQNIGGSDVRVHLWDLSGSPEYIDVRNELYTGSDAIFLVYDVTCQASFESIDSWLREASKYSKGNPEIFLVANKIDLNQKRVVSTADGKKCAGQHKLRYYEASAATGEGVDKLFSDLLMSIITGRKSGPTSSCTNQRRDSKVRGSGDTKWNAKLAIEIQSAEMRGIKSAKH
ncbi:LOW QUALITY PROTEIN: ras-related protein Rab-13-like [Gigantopelta aegis]|uniref:LOW QUALITY PROTEIN: ras-related protein Rab-13-like n=1 Tax=Gigantopelta aegis TaxID=1735272 RepID=UPI001B889299|nr:LOW QUALITY PROTEIN: ras-related protein Rab-13-like [Gigantopelta aegis]